MSEEEVIKVLKNHAQYTNAKVIDANTRKEYKVSEAIQGLLDLYNKEKEKNEKLELEIEELKEESKEYQIGFAQGCYEKDLDWEDKIKAKIEELDYNDIGNFERRCKQEVLQSLLEKE